MPQKSLKLFSLSVNQHAVCGNRHFGSVNPLILCDKFILVPVKGREAIGKYDSLLGYIVLQHATHGEQDNNKTIIYFGSDVTVIVYDYFRTVRQNIERAKWINKKTCE